MPDTAALAARRAVASRRERFREFFYIEGPWTIDEPIPIRRTVNKGEDVKIIEERGEATYIRYGRPLLLAAA